jgi:hypothetical protein
MDFSGNEFYDYESEEGDDDERMFVIAVTVNETEWLPQLVLGVPVDGPMAAEGTPPNIAAVILSHEEGLEVGLSLLKSAQTVAQLYTELLDKPVEARKEILSLESQLFMDVDFS